MTKEDQIKEVMGMVKSLAVASTCYGVFRAMSNPEQTGAIQEAKELECAIESKLRELLPVWQPIESAPVGKTVLACNALGYVGKAVLRNGKWENIGRPTGWMPLPKALE